MKFEKKVSGTKVTDFEIEPLFENQLISLQEIIALDLSQDTMDWILDTLRFYKEVDKRWVAIIDRDTIYKITILEKYPNYQKELKEYFGDRWMNFYIRFGH